MGRGRAPANLVPVFPLRPCARCQLSHLGPSARGGEERRPSPAFNPGSHTRSVPAVTAGLAADGTGSGTNVCPVAPQEAWPDLPSSPCLRQQDKYTLTPGLPAGPICLSGRPTGQRSRACSRALLGPPPGPSRARPRGPCLGKPTARQPSPNKASRDPGSGYRRPPAIPPALREAPERRGAPPGTPAQAGSWRVPRACSSPSFGFPEAGAPARSQGG